MSELPYPPKKQIGSLFACLNECFSDVQVARQDFFFLIIGTIIAGYPINDRRNFPERNHIAFNFFCPMRTVELVVMDTKKWLNETKPRPTGAEGASGVSGGSDVEGETQ